MIELVSVQRFMLGNPWTLEDRAILQTHVGLTMAAHDMRDAINMRAEMMIGDFVGRMIRAAKEQS